jgi:hypothetical protein
MNGLARSLVIAALWLGPATVQADPLSIAGDSPDADLEQRLQSALVHCQSSFFSGVGVLVGDSRTVLVANAGMNMGRPFRVIAWDRKGGAARSVEVRTHRVRGNEVLVLRLDRDLPGNPLTLSEEELAVSAEVVTLQRSEPGDRTELARVMVTGVSASTLQLATGGSGMPVATPSGELLALGLGGGRAVRVQSVLAQARRRGMSVIPLVGLRIGYHHNGTGGFLLSIDAGATLWDRLSIALNVGVAFKGKDQLLAVTEQALGPGTVLAYPSNLILGLEARYRQLLFYTAYLDLVLGVQTTHSAFSSRSPALFGQAGCDPTSQACAIQVRDPDKYLDRASSWGVGPVFGVDLRFNVASIGYRFTPAKLSRDLPNTHSVLFGLGF